MLINRFPFLSAFFPPKINWIVPEVKDDDWVAVFSDDPRKIDIGAFTEKMLLSKRQVVQEGKRRKRSNKEGKSVRLQAKRSRLKTTKPKVVFSAKDWQILQSYDPRLRNLQATGIGTTHVPSTPTKSLAVSTTTEASITRTSTKTTTENVSHKVTDPKATYIVQSTEQPTNGTERTSRLLEDWFETSTPAPPAWIAELPEVLFAAVPLKAKGFVLTDVVQPRVEVRPGCLQLCI